MKNLNAEQLIALAASTALKLAKDIKGDELTVLADFFNLIGSILTLFSDKESPDNSLS